MNSVDTEQLRQQLVRFEGFLKADPDNVRLIEEVAELYFRLGSFDRLESLLQQGLQKYPQHAGLLFRRATLSMTRGQYEDAIEQYQALLEKEEAPAIRYNLAYALSLAGRYEEALAELNKIHDIEGSLAVALILKARVYHHLGELGEALACATRFAELQPQNSEAAGILALLYFDQSQMDRASEWAEKALDTDPDNLEALVSIGSIALDEQDEAIARKYFTHALGSHPKSGRAWAGMGLTRMLATELPQAQEDLKKAVQHMPDHIGTWHALAWCQIALNDLTGAEESLKASLALDRNFGETHGGLAVVAFLNDRFDEAENSAKKALRLDPGCFSGRFAQSLLLARTGDQQKAQNLLNDIFMHRFEPQGQTLQQSIITTMRKTGRRQ